MYAPTTAAMISAIRFSTSISNLPTEFQDQVEQAERADSESDEADIRHV